MDNPPDEKDAEPSPKTASEDQDRPREAGTVAHGVTDKPPSSDPTESKGRNEEGAWQRKHSSVGLWINGIIGCFAIAGFFTALCQIRSAAKDAEESKRLARETFAIERRAWIGTSDLFPFPIEEGKPVSGGVEITNSGATPALEVTSHLAIDDRPRPFRLTDLFVDYSWVGSADPDPSVMVIYPGMKFVMMHTARNVVATKDRIREWGDGSRILYMFGCTTYADIFGGKHASEFCLVLAYEKKSPVWCPVHNDADCDPR